jgi:hypothetical protein
MPRSVSLRQRLTELIPELAKFGAVGLIGAVIDLGGAAYLHGSLGVGPLVAKGLSILAAMVVTYLGSRFWTFRHRVNQALLREGMLFVALNVVGLAIAEVGGGVAPAGGGGGGAREGSAGVQRGERDGNRARDDLPLLHLQEVGVPGRSARGGCGGRGSRRFRVRRRE